MLQADKHLYGFGPFRLDARDRALLREGQLVPLAPKAIETLLVLVERSGRIVDKDELLHLVWPDTFVEEVNLAKNVSTLRKTLGEDEGHHYIETIPKRGYRFVAEVQDLTSVIEAPSPSPPVSTRKPAVPFIVTGVVALLGLAALGIWLLRKDAPPAPGQNIPLTSNMGRENQVAFSPDGNQIAFAWDELQNGNQRICVKMIGSETVLPLTAGQSADSKPAWSPDGRYVAFIRSTPQTRAYYLISALGGAERKLADVYPYLDLGIGNSTYFSPDGNQLAIIDKQSASEPFAIFLLSLSNLAKQRLTSPPPGSTGDYYPAFSPDGKSLAFVRSSSFSTTDLYVTALAGGEPHRLTSDGLTIQGLAWTPDSHQIIFSSRRGGSISYLWRISAAGGEPQRVGALGKEVVSPAIAPGGKRLAYTQALDDTNIWRIELDSTGKASTPAPILASTFWDADPDYSPDGSKIAFSSGRSGGFGIWISDAAGGNPRLLFDGGPYLTGTPRWSPDGRWIAFDSRSNPSGTGGNPDIFVISSEGGVPRRVTDHSAEDVAPSWSRDGKWIYFGSGRTGSSQIWKVAVEGREPIQVTRNGGFEAFESADGQSVYYLKARGAPGIWRVPSRGGEEALVTDQNQAGLWRYWRVSAQGIYYGTASHPHGARLEFFDFKTGLTRKVAALAKDPDMHIPGLAVSPDGRSLVYAQKDQSGSDIMMIEGFR